MTRPTRHGRASGRRRDGATAVERDLELVAARLTHVVGAGSQLPRLSSVQVPERADDPQRRDNEGPGWVPSRPAPPATAPEKSPRAQPSYPAGVEPSVDPYPARTPRLTLVVRALTARLPLELRAASVTPARAAVVGLLLVALLALFLGLAFGLLSRPDSRPAPPRRAEPSRGAAVASVSSDSSPTPSRVVVVHVAGAVRRPGVVRVAAGSRVSDAIAGAGGAAAKAELASVNLARVLVDGEQLVVLAKGQLAAAAASGQSPQGAPGTSAQAPVDLNAATVDQLEGLPGVGPVLAQRIIDWRTRNGRFHAVDELLEVAGIGDAKFADLKSRVRV